KIAFDSNRDGKAVWVMNADGSGQTKLTNKPMSIEGLPVFSPGGSTRHDSVSHTCEHTSR
ncbi:MAG: hypothetical protein ACRDKY_08440, partial [Solirubrobacteraceae bacterium]